MILPMTEVDTIKHIQKAHTSHMTAFESVFDKVERKEKERKEKAENERKKKAAILSKQRLEKRKAESDRKAKETQRRDAENRARQQIEQHNAPKEVSSRFDGGDGGSEHTQGNPTPRTNQDIQNNGRETNDTSGIYGGNISNGLGTTWSEVSPEAAANYMASKTGVPASRWMAIIYHESTNNPTVTNSIGCFGYLQLHPVHGAVSQMTPQQYLDTAVGVYQSQGLAAWEVVTMGRA